MNEMNDNRNDIVISESNKRIIIATCLLMIFSMYAPYVRILTYIYQIAVLAFILFVAKKNVASAIFPLIILTTTRDYIAVSVSESFTAYYGINGIILIGIMLAISLMFLVKRHFTIPNIKSSLLLVVFGMQMLLSRVIAVCAEEYGQFFIGICMMYMIIPFIIDSYEDILMSRIAFCVAGLFMAIGVLPYIVNYSALSSYTAFINGNSLLVDRNYQSLFIMICVLQTLVLLIEGGCHFKWYIKVSFFIVIIVDLFIVIAGGSRSAILTLVAAGIVYLLVNRKNTNRFFTFLLLASIAVIVAFQMGLLDTILERFQATDVSSGNGRIIIWQKFIDSYYDGNIFTWIFGRGLVGRVYTNTVAHNVFISILFCFGIFGIVLYVGNIISTVVSCMKSNHSNELIVLVPMLIMCCTLEPYYRIEGALYISLISSIATFYMRRRQIDEI